ncbi:MFS transporter [Lusitaniella coriacea LEGE 07157]|uniref:MFS transporter n=1 Tax=Lusitaniella coriacea LEGE 07157 TaxID=945747 RepID=A0A8J7DZJ4_9CYAN|nr:MFS transporter [Lusitaniella coriacea]MBE9118175.1 MFS transporter [Lusitaniella coriacea LEGE 07157]
MRLSDPEQTTQNQPNPTDASAPEENNASSPATHQGFAPVLKNRHFLVLWSGQIFSQLADKVYLVLMIALIASRFQSANQSISGWVSGIMIAFTIPAILFGSLAGVYVDRWSKKGVLVSSNLLRGMLVLTLPFLLWLSQNQTPLLGLPVGFWVLVGVTFVVSTLTQFFAPAEQSAIPLIVERENLLPANSLYTTTMMALLIVGFAVGEPLLALADCLVARLGVGWDFGKELVVGGSYAIAGLILLFLKTGEKAELLDQERPHVFQDIWDGIRYLSDHHRIRNAMVQLVILFSVFAALAVLAVRLAETLPGMKAEQFGFLLAAGGIGMGCSAFILGHWGQRFSHARLSLWGSIGVASSLIGLAFFTHHLWLTLLMTALLGGFAALVGVPMQTTIQAETPEEMRGKVFGLQNNAVNIALSLPLALAGVAETFFGLRWVFLGLAAMVLLGSALSGYIFRTAPSSTES